MVGNQVFQESNVIDTLLRLSRSGIDGCLKVVGAGVTWQLHLTQGRLVYASDSISAWDRLERLLRHIGCQPSAQAQEAHARSPFLFADNLDSQTDGEPVYQAVSWLLKQPYLSPNQSSTLIQECTLGDKPLSQDPSYQAIYWLFDHDLISPMQVTALVSEVAREVIQLLLSLTNGSYEFVQQDQLAGLPKLCKLGLEPLLNEGLQRLRSWQILSPQVWSPYQRPYFFSQADQQNQLSPELQQKLGSLLKGLSFRHLASVLKKDDLQLAQSLHPYVKQGIVFLREPQAPFDKLPRIPDPQKVTVPESVMALRANLVAGSTKLAPSTPPAPSEKTYIVACVDDSLVMLSQITRLLGDERFSIIAINSPVKALMQIVRAKPDLILLDVGMPGMDGYELCRLLRNHPLFEKTPVIMVTGHTGIIDRAKAKLVGASDYLTKPFTKESLLKMVFKNTVKLE